MSAQSSQVGAGKTRIVILGGGFAGVATAQSLAKRFKKDASVEISLINRDNHFVFLPLLASAAAGSIETMHVVTPIRQVIDGVQFRHEEVLSVDVGRRQVTTASRATGRERHVQYDHLVIALGNIVDLSRIPGAAQHAKVLKTMGDAVAIRNHVLQMLEAADIESDPQIRREVLTFVVVGGGFSGVEMVGELNDMVHRAVKLYPSITKDQIRVMLLHSGDRILPEMGEEIADYALKQLRKRGVEVRLGVRLEAATQREAVLQGGTKISTRSLIAAVGNAPPPILADMPVQKDRGKVVVDEFMQVPGAPGVWAIGDNAIVPNMADKGGKPSPPTGRFAEQQGKVLATNIAASMRGGKLTPFSYNGKGMLCLVGHGSGVGELPAGLKVKGFIGWFMWRSVYWGKLPHFTRKVQVGVDWFFDLFLPRDIAQLNLGRTQTITRSHFQPGELIVRQGDPGDHFYVIIDGEVEVVRDRSSGAQEILARLGRGQSFGETALVTGRRRNASVRALTPVDVIAMGRDDFSVLTSTWAEFGEQVTEMSEDRLSAAPPTQFLNLSHTQILEALSSRRGDGAQLSSDSAEETPAMIGVLRRRTGQDIELKADLVSIGRSPDNNIVIAEQSVSRRHSLMQRDGDDWWLEDLGGTNGTWVNGSRIADRVQLKPGDDIQIGAAQFTFQFIAPPKPVRPVAPAPVPSITQIIQGLDAAKAAGAPAPEPEVGPITAMIHSLDRPQQHRGPTEPAGSGASPGAEPRSAPVRVAEPQPVPVVAGDVSGRMTLRVEGGPAIGTVYPVSMTGATIGRSPENTIRIEDERLSRHHARIDYSNGGFYLIHLSRTNHTYLNGTQVDVPQLLRTGDTVEAGGTRLVVGL